MSKIKLIFGASMLFFCSFANAVIIGDKDWLQVTETTGYSWNDFDTLFDLSTGACDVANCLLGGPEGKNMTEYIWADNASVSDLIRLYTDYEGHLPTHEGDRTNLSVNALENFFADFEVPATQALGSISDYREFIDGWTRSYTLFSQETTGDRYRLSRCVCPENESPDWVQVYENSRNQQSEIVGGWFYKPVAIPEPSIMALFAIGLFGLGFARRRA